MENELFEKTPVPKAYFTLALPVVLSMVVSLIYSLVDTYFIAGTNNTNLIAGVTIGAPVFTLMIALGDIFGLGGSSLISRLMGEKRDDDVRRISSVCFWSSIVLGIIVMVLLLIFHKPVLHLLGASKDTYTYALQYYLGIVLGAPFMIFSLVPGNILRTEGLVTASMAGSICGAVLNIILDPIFISVLGLGALGAAIASSLGYVLTDIVLVFALLKKSKKLSMNPKIYAISQSEITSLLAIGIPASITNLMQSFGVMIQNRSLLSYGNDKIAAMGVAMKINMIAVLLLVGFAFGAQPLIGYNYGAKNTKRLKESIRFTCGFGCGLALFLTVLLAVPANQIVKLFLEDVSVASEASMMLRFQLSSMICISFIMATTVISQSMGKAVGAFVLSVSRQGVIFFITITLMNQLMGYKGVIMAQPVADLFTAVIAVVCLRNYLVSIKKDEMQRMQIGS